MLIKQQNKINLFTCFREKNLCKRCHKIARSLPEKTVAVEVKRSWI